MRTLLLAATALLGASVAAQAAPVTIAAFGQPVVGGVAAPNGFFLTPNAGDTATALSMTNITVLFTAYAGGPVISGIMNLTANSVGPALLVLGNDAQRYSGSFSITSGPGGTGTDFISGTFADSVFGAAGGTGLTVQVSDPTESLTLTSSLIPVNQLATPNSFSLSLVTGSAPLAIVGSGATATLGCAAGSLGCPTGANAGQISYFATGDVSASVATPTPEPASLALLGVGLLGLGFVASRKRSV
jgi:hypothetical protein